MSCPLYRGKKNSLNRQILDTQEFSVILSLTFFSCQGLRGRLNSKRKSLLLHEPSKKYYQPPDTLSMVFHSFSQFTSKLASTEQWKYLNGCEIVMENLLLLETRFKTLAILWATLMYGKQWSDQYPHAGNLWILSNATESQTCIVVVQCTSQLFWKVWALGHSQKQFE